MSILRPRLDSAPRQVVVLSLLALFVISLTFLEERAMDAVREVTPPPISAAGIGNPYVNFSDGSLLETSRVGDMALVAAVESGLARPLSITVADFDNDGVEDLVTGYSGTSSRQPGIIGIRRGNIDARHPNLEGARERKAAGRFTDAPFFPTETLLSLETRPDLLESGDFNNDGNVDLAFAAKGGLFVHVKPGLGTGRFRRAVPIEVDAGVTAMASADVNRRDGLPELLVGTNGSSESQLLVFESPEGALNAGAEAFATNAPVVDIATGQFDDDDAIDIAVAAGHEIRIISGRDRQLSLAVKDRASAAAADIDVIQMASNVRAIAPGDFNDEDTQDLAIILDSGHLGIMDGQTHVVETTPYRFENTVDLGSSKVSTRPGSDLVVLEKDQVHILHRDHLAGGRPIPEAQPLDLNPVTLKMYIEGVALYSHRHNGDGLRDMAITGLVDGAAAVAIVNSAPLTTFNVNDNSTAKDETPGDGLCRTESGTCTLLAASMEIRSTEGPHLITFSVTDIQTAVNETIWTFTETVTIDGESFGSRVAILGFLGSLKFDARTSGNLVKGLSVPSVTAWDYFTIVNTYVGVDAAGETLLDGAGGVFIGGTGNDIGGANANERNVLSRLKFSGANDAIIFNNYIGTNAEGTKGIGSTGIGVDIGNSSSAVVLGGSLAGQGNVISGMEGSNGNTGIGVKVSFSENILIRGNLIGTDVSGFFALGNRSDGIQAFSSTSILGNVIAANGEEGITTSHRDDQPITIQGNLIGTDATGEVALPNAMQGIKIGSDSQVIVGGVTEGAGNVISGNGTHGIETSGFSSNDQAHIIQGNQIGTTRSGTPLPNQEHGIQLGNDAGSLVGGADPLAANTIAYNLLHGITFRSNNAVGHTITGNSIYGNELLGIGMQSFSDKPLKNDPGDADTGPNNRQNYPEISVNGDGTVGVTFNSSPSQPFTIDFYGSGECDDSGFGEGRYYLTSMDAATDANGDAAFDIQVLAAEGQQFISSTATDSTGSTSEFSNCIQIDATPAPVVIVRSDSLGVGFAPVIKNTSFNVFKVDWADPDGYLTSVGTQTTDDEGRLILDPNEFAPGDEFLISAKVGEVLSKKGGHDVVDGVAYKTVVDNLIVEQDGGIHAVRLEPSIEQPTTTYMGHMTVVFNFVVSIEWPASTDYAVGLVSAFAYASNYLFDVSNGQARFGKIAIYDDKTNWKHADVRMHASNTVWPRAAVYGIGKVEGSLNMPPKHYGGDTKANINEIYPDVEIDPGNVATALTLGHEFGHFGFGLYDEYKGPDKDGRKGSVVHPFTHFSFMDDQFADHKRSSEMSAFESFSTLENEDFRGTEQYVDSKGRDGWTTFKLLFSTLETPNIPALVHTPARVRVTYPDVITGPNDDLDNPDLNVGNLIEWALDLSIDDTPRPGYLVVDTQTGGPAAGLTVSARRKLPSGSRWLEQGKTVITGSDRGKIRPFGLKPGDELVAVGQASGRYSFGKILAPAVSSGKLDDEIIVQVSQLDGDQQMLARVEIRAEGGLRYEVQTGASLGGQPSVDIIAGDAPSETVVLDGGPTEYAVDLPALFDNEPTLVLNAKDTDGTEYPVPHTLSIFDVDTSSTTFSPASAGLEIALDQAASTIQKIAIMSSPFPAPEEGLPDSLKRVSPVYGISVGPGEGQFKASLVVYYDADSLLTRSPTGVTIFKWESGWKALPTGVEHTISQTATAEIDGPGFYVAYLDLRSATATHIETDEIPGAGEDHGLLQNFPNPFSGSTEIPLVIESPTQVSLVVYNVLGQQVGQLAPRLLQAGEHRIAYDASGLPAGTYIYVIDFEGAKKTGVMLVAR